MCKHTGAALAAIVLLLTSVIAHPQASPSQQRRIDVRIPFSFTVGDSQFSAGTSSFMLSTDRLRVRSGGAEALVLVNRMSGQEAAQTKVVFNQYGEHYFLTQLWYKGYPDGVQVTKSKAESELEGKGEQPKRIVLAVK